MSYTSSSTRAALIKFDLSSLSGVTRTENPILMHYYVSNYGDVATLQELDVAWDETTTTYNSLPFVEASWRTTDVFSADISGETGWRSVDVTSSVSAFLDGTRTNNGSAAFAS